MTTQEDTLERLRRIRRRFVGAIVLHCEKEGCAIEDLSPAVLKGFSDAIGPDLYACLDYDAILDQGIKSEMKRIGGGGD